MKNKSLRFSVLAILLSFALAFIITGCTFGNLRIMTGSVGIVGNEAAGETRDGDYLRIVYFGVQADGLIEYSWFSVDPGNPSDRESIGGTSTLLVGPLEIGRLVHVELSVTGYVNTLVSEPLLVVPSAPVVP